MTVFLAFVTTTSVASLSTPPPAAAPADGVEVGVEDDFPRSVA